MSRLSQRPRSRSRSSHRGSETRNSWIIATAIVGSVVAAFVFGFFWMQKAAHEFEYDAELCLANQPLAGHTIMIIDSTDVFNDKESAYLKRLIEQTKASLIPFAKFSIFTIDHQKGGFPRMVFSLCNPGTAKTANALVQAPRHVQERFDLEFAQPLKKITENLNTQQGAQFSPILETLQTISELKTFQPSVPNRQLIIYSDMLQNSSSFSQYSKNWRGLSDEVIGRYRAQFSDVLVSVHYVMHIPALQDVQHRSFWNDFFTNRGARYGFFFAE